MPRRRPPVFTGFDKEAIPYMLPTDNKLRRKIGLQTSMEEVFTPEMMKQCQAMVDNTHSEFLQEMQEQITRLGVEYVNAAEKPAEAASILQKAGELAITIKKRMEALGFVFGFEVAKSLCEYIQSVVSYTPDAMLIACKHIAVLNIVVKDNITDDGGEVGKEMLENLKKLIRKVES